MIFSMTAFARLEAPTPLGYFVCELRSVNHRFLEISVHVPENLRALEMMLREQIRQVIKRGKIECILRWQPNTENRQDLFAINIHLAQALAKAAEQIATFFTQPAPCVPTDILRMPGVLEMKALDVDVIKPKVSEIINQALAELVNARQREGQALQQIISQRLDKIFAELSKVQQRLPQVLLEQQQRIENRLTEIKAELEPQRLEQEMLLFTNRIDVAEEIERAQLHVQEIKRIIHEGGAMGRRLDFLLQELNREANTLGSKSSDGMITHAAVELKVLIEQIREQIQNIE